MAGQLLADGLTMVSPENADVVVVNTCAFIGPARTESRETVQSVCAMKREGRCQAVFVAGCYPQRYRKTLKREFPEVDGFIGLDALDRIGDLIRQWQKGKPRLTDIPPSSHRLFEPALPGLRFAQGPYAYLKIAEGCHHRCAFCAIPLIRGDYRSRSLAHLVKEAEALIATGARELNLISQDSMAYGRDTVEHDETNPLLPALLTELEGIAGDFWIRILYGSVHMIGNTLLNIMRDSAKICRYLDVPIQHSHPEILRAMGRSASARDLPGVIARLRASLPGLALRTTCMVGFPGETDTHFRHLLRFVQEMAFDHLGVFVYSPEAGTPAARLPGRVDSILAEDRRDLILAAQKKVVARKAKALMNKTDAILLEQPLSDSPGVWLGRSYRQAPSVDGKVIVDAVPARARTGDTVHIRYIGRKGYDLVAQYEECASAYPSPNASSKTRSDLGKSRFLTKEQASSAPNSRSMAASSHSTDSGPV